MWSCTEEDDFRHMYGVDRGIELASASCGRKQYGNLDHTKLYLPKCEICQRLWKVYFKRVNPIGTFTTERDVLDGNNGLLDTDDTVLVTG